MSVGDAVPYCTFNGVFANGIAASFAQNHAFATELRVSSRESAYFREQSPHQEYLRD